MDWLMHMEHLQSVLKKFNAIATFLDDFFISSFQDGLKPSVCIQMNKRNSYLDDWQKVIK